MPEFVLRDYERILKRRLPTIITVFLSVVIATGAFTLTRKKLYKATATLKFQITPVEQTALFYEDLMSIIGTEIKVIGSYEVALIAAKNLKDESLADDILSSISAGRIEGTTLVGITAKHTDPLKAARYVNAVADAYIEYDIETRTKKAAVALEVLEKRKIEVETNLKKLEDEKTEFLRTHKTATGIGGQIAMGILQAKTKKEDLLKKYTPNHPDVEALDREIQLLEAQLSKLPKEELELARITRDIKVNEDLYTEILKQYEEAKIQKASVVSIAKVVSYATPPARAYYPNYTLNFIMSIILGICLAVLAAFIKEQLDTTISTIEELENLLKLPVLSTIPHAALMEESKYFIKKGTRERLENVAKKTLLYFPRESPFFEAYNTLRTRLISKIEKKNASLLITSSQIAEGKTLTLINLALAMAANGDRVCVIEADFRRSIISRLFGINRQPGLSDIFLENFDTEQAIKGMTEFLLGSFPVDVLLKFHGIENLFIITTGRNIENPLPLFQKDTFKQIIRRLLQKFNYILVDAPPLLIFSDALVIAHSVDNTILIYQSGRVPSSAIKRTKALLDEHKIPTIGIVVNDITPRELTPYYGYKHYNYYYKYKKET